MKRNFIVLLTILICSVTACQSGQKKDRNMDKETKLKIETSAGDIIVKLYNETPQHRNGKPFPQKPYILPRKPK